MDMTMWTVDRDGKPISLHATRDEADKACEPGDTVTERTGPAEHLTVLPEKGGKPMT